MSNIAFFKQEGRLNVHSSKGLVIHSDEGTDITELLGVLDDLEIPVKKTADVVLSYGGDGTLLGAIAQYNRPFRYFLPVRRFDSHGETCWDHNIRIVLTFLFGPRMSYWPRGLLCNRLNRLHVSSNGKLIGKAVNDVTIRQVDPTMALRYSLSISPPKEISLSSYSTKEIVGDGIVGATPFGSSGYYRSITKSVFRDGMGLAFNNSTEAVDHQVLPIGSEVKFHVHRGNIMVIMDNQKPYFPERDEIISFRATSWVDKDNPVIVNLSALTCKDCRQKDGMPMGFRHV